MHNRIAGVVCLMAAAIFGFGIAPGFQAQATEADTADASEAVRAANAQFYTALNALFTGDVAPMEAVWSHGDEVMYLPPMRARIAGWDGTQAVWQEVANMKLGGQVEAHDVTVTMLSPKLALVVTTEMGQNPNAPGGPMQVDIRSTKLFRLEDGDWKLFYDHVDLLPNLTPSGT